MIKRILLSPVLLVAANNVSAQVPAAASTTQPIKIVLVGDSTVATEGGWGPAFCAATKPGVTCIDLALNGRSTKSFLDEGAWRKALAERGQYYFIQFGHNDQKPDPSRHADAKTDYAANLRRYIADVRAVGGTPVIVSSLSRRNYADGKLIVSDGLKEYAASARNVATEEKVPFVDLYALSTAYLSGMTQEQADKFNATTNSDAANEKASATKPDRTHLNDRGKTVFGDMVVKEVARTQPALRPYLQTP